MGSVNEPADRTPATDTEDGPRIKELRELAIHIATEAAEMAARMRHEGVAVAATKSSSTDVVTEADRATEQHIRELISEARPDDAILGEEGDSVSGTTGLTWVVDPIDGTVNYLYGIGSWAVSVAVVEGEPEPTSWRTLAGSVVAPRLSEVYSAGAGEGATLNGRPLRLEPHSGLSDSLVATGFGYESARRTAQGRVVAQLLGSVRDIRRMGSAALDLCAVAAGRVDAYYELGTKPWDHAAGALVAREAGAWVGGLKDDERESERMLVAANPGISKQLRAALRDAGA